MKILADESVEAEIVACLRQNGFSVVYIVESAPGIDDEKVLEQAIENNALLITSDKDFGELVFRFRRYAHGVLLYRLHGKTERQKAEIVLSVMIKNKETLTGNFTVIGEDKVRIRKLHF